MLIKTININGEKVLVGKHCGSGGNGAVFLLRREDEQEVVKFFDVGKKKANEKKKRYDRFRKEVKVVSSVQSEIAGIVPINASYLPEELPREGNEAWYVMPRGRKFQISASKGIIEKLTEMKMLGLTLSELHKKSLAHRDIKPDNILYLNDRLCLSDFGLIWCGTDDTRITDTGERVGPIGILPPELWSISKEMNIDYCKSDVYLFAKVLWMYLSRNEVGFIGEYRRNRKEIYLNKNQYGISTFEPIQRMLEGATKDDVTQRIEINECLQLISEQIGICEGVVKQERVNELCYEETKSFYFQNTLSDATVYTDIYKITKFIENIIHESIFVISYADVRVELSATSVEPFGNQCIRLINTIAEKKCSYVIRVKELTIANECVKLGVIPVDKETQEGISYFDPKKVPGLDVNFYIDRICEIAVCAKK